MPAAAPSPMINASRPAAYRWRMYKHGAAQSLVCIQSVDCIHRLLFGGRFIDLRHRLFGKSVILYYLNVVTEMNIGIR